MVEVTITVNGAPFPLKRQMTIADLIHDLLIPEHGLIVEYNGTLYKENFESFQLQSGDTVEFIHFMGGG